MPQMIFKGDELQGKKAPGEDVRAKRMQQRPTTTNHECFFFQVC